MLKKAILDGQQPALDPSSSVQNIALQVDKFINTYYLCVLYYIYSCNFELMHWTNHRFVYLLRRQCRALVFCIFSYFYTHILVPLIPFYPDIAGILALLPRIFITSHTPDIDILVPQIFIPRTPARTSDILLVPHPRTPDIHILVPHLRTPVIYTSHTLYAYLTPRTPATLQDRLRITDRHPATMTSLPPLL